MSNWWYWVSVQSKHRKLVLQLSKYFLWFICSYSYSCLCWFSNLFHGADKLLGVEGLSNLYTWPWKGKWIIAASLLGSYLFLRKFCLSVLILQSNRSLWQDCFSPLWVAFAILIGVLLLDVLISITLGVSALPVNIIIGMYTSLIFFPSLFIGNYILSK